MKELRSAVNERMTALCHLVIVPTSSYSAQMHTPSFRDPFIWSDLGKVIVLHLLKFFFFLKKHD